MDLVSFVLTPAVIIHFIQKDYKVPVSHNDLDTLFNIAVETTEWGRLMHPDPADVEIDPSDIADSLVYFVTSP